MFSFFRRKVKYTNPFEQGWLMDMVDIHCHLLPNVDDGSKSIEETFSLMEFLHGIGVRKHIFTPHIMEDYPMNKAVYLRARFDEFLSSIPDRSSDFRLAAEYMLDSSFSERITESLLTLSDRHILVETSYLAPPMGLMGLLADLRLKGLLPVLAHPERYVYMTEKDYLSLKNQGVIFQLNLFSLFGAYSSRTLDKAYGLLDADFYDVIGTDLHHLGHMPRIVEDANLPVELEGKIKSLVENNIRLFTF